MILCLALSCSIFWSIIWIKQTNRKGTYKIWIHHKDKDKIILYCQSKQDGMLIVLDWDAIKNYHTGWFINNRNVFLSLLEAGSLRSWCHRSWILVRTLFQVSNCHPFTVFSREGVRELSGGIFTPENGINPIHEDRALIT